jgi:Fe-S-cluster-containing hydrogenase component 2
MKAFVLDQECMGCGLCVIKCPQQAMHLEIVRPPEHIPTHSHLASKSSVLAPPPAPM